MAKKLDSKISDYLAFIGSKGGRTTGSHKARKMGREHYARVAEIQRERWRKWRLARGVNGSAKPIRNGSAKATGA
jgi:hypothetical protein